jgi:spore coat protein A, manganese oxidase
VEDVVSDRVKSLALGFVSIAALLAAAGGPGYASDQIPQTWLPGDCIPQFATPLPVFGPGYNAALPRVDALKHPLLTITMKETERQVLPDFVPNPALCPAVNIQPTRVWAYETADAITKKVLGPAFWPAVTLETRRHVPTVVRYVNDLPTFDPMNPTGPGMLQGLITVDQSIHWADPERMGCMMMTPPVDCSATPDSPCCRPYGGAPPAVPHLHGGETPSAFDGGPEQWFTPDGKRGKDYRTLGAPGPGKAIYSYDNAQEPGTPWFHDHALGATRTNVYSGMAGFYFIRDPLSEPRRLPTGAYEIEMAIQDRQFDTNSQLFFPDGAVDVDGDLNGTPPNPEMHPFWIPEFIGDVAIVNGSPWPYLKVEPRRYRFRIVDGSNARMYNLSFGRAPVYLIGADDAYLDTPTRVGKLFLAPGERADIIVDFSGLRGRSITVTNDAPVPFPDGLVPGVDQPGMAKIMQFQVTLPLKGADASCSPVAGGCRRPVPLVRLTNGHGRLADGVRIARVRQLILKEVESETGPEEVLVNNTNWDGLRSPSVATEFPTDGVSETPRVGSTELWEIINLTMDAHPMHTHLAQFQILNRQRFDEDAYLAAYFGAFGSGPVPLLPGCLAGDYCPGYWPPLSYGTPNADGAIGGNPAVGRYLLGASAPPAPEESGWKDTAKVQPGEVLRMVVRWAPTSTPVLSARPGRNLYPFDPTKGPGYVWHCHIIDHEDNEMMRPYAVSK